MLNQQKESPQNIHHSLYEYLVPHRFTKRALKGPEKKPVCFWCTTFLSGDKVMV